MTDTAAQIAALKREVAMLRRAIWDEWDAGHSEYCKPDGPCEANTGCYWPMPDVLGNKKPPRVTS